MLVAWMNSSTALKANVYNDVDQHSNVDTLSGERGGGVKVRNTRIYSIYNIYMYILNCIFKDLEILSSSKPLHFIAKHCILLLSLSLSAYKA